MNPVYLQRVGILHQRKTGAWVSESHWLCCERTLQELKCQNHFGWGKACGLSRSKAGSPSEFSTHVKPTLKTTVIKEPGGASFPSEGAFWLPDPGFSFTSPSNGERIRKEGCHIWSGHRCKPPRRFSVRRATQSLRPNSVESRKSASWHTYGTRHARHNKNNVTSKVPRSATSHLSPKSALNWAATGSFNDTGKILAWPAQAKVQPGSRTFEEKRCQVSPKSVLCCTWPGK